MKKIILTIIFTVFLFISLATAGILIQKNKTIDLSIEAEQFYSAKDLSPSYKDYEQEEKFWRCLISNTNFNLPCSQRHRTYWVNCIELEIIDGKETGECLNEEKIYFTKEEKETKLDNWMNERLEDIAQVYLDRESKAEKEEIREGEITINSK